MRSESGQKETPGPLNRKRSRKGSQGIQKETPAPVTVAKGGRGSSGVDERNVPPPWRQVNANFPEELCDLAP